MLFDWDENTVELVMFEFSILFTFLLSKSSTSTRACMCARVFELVVYTCCIHAHNTGVHVTHMEDTRKLRRDFVAVLSIRVHSTHGNIRGSLSAVTMETSPLSVVPHLCPPCSA